MQQHLCTMHVRRHLYATLSDEHIIRLSMVYKQMQREAVFIQCRVSPPMNPFEHSFETLVIFLNGNV